MNDASRRITEYQSFLKTGRPDDRAGLGLRAELSGDNPIFSESIRTRIADAHFEMSALSIGIQLELSSEQYYRRQSEMVVVDADDTKKKKLQRKQEIG